MARHNFLIQRHISGPDGADANCEGKCAGWIDCGTRSRQHSDEFGNTGFANVEDARADIADLRKHNPQHSYRIIQIIS